MSLLAVVWRRLLAVEILQLHRPSFPFADAHTELPIDSKWKSHCDWRSVSQSVSKSFVSSPNWGSWPDIYYCLTVTVLFLWGALSDERAGLSFTIAADPHQRSHSRVRIPCDSRPRFTVSDSRLPFSSPPTTSRVTVEVFDPSTRECLST
jgi:hypothetical protein